MSYETILLSRKDHIATITLNRPDKLNALLPKTEEELAAAIKEVAEDDQARVLVVTGAGRAFCAGVDLSALPGGGGVTPSEYASGSPDGIRRGFRHAQEIILGLQRLEKPTIAMVNGVATGAGLDIACGCDMRIGSPNTRLIAGYTRIGLFPGWGGTWLYARIVGLPKAAEMLFTGDAIEAQEAHRLGLLNGLVPAEQLEKATYELAERMANNAPIAIRLSKIQLYKGLEMDLETAMQVAAACETITLTSEDHKEGVAALRERRPPKYQGK